MSRECEQLKRAGLVAFALTLCAWPVTAAAQPETVMWTIKGGSYGGTVVPIDMARASRKGRFLRLAAVRGQERIVGWNPSRLPIAVGFRGGLVVSSTDSVAFWSSLRQLEQDLGVRLFEPVTLEHGDDPDDVIVVDVRPMMKDDGLTLVTWSTFGSVYDARIFFRSRETLQDRRVVSHEMMHALGFGHTSAWYSMMNPAPRLDSRLTVEDVAHAQFALSSRALSEREDIWSRLALAVEREPRGSGNYGQCDPFTPPVRFPARCTSVPCSVPSASCGAARSTAPWPVR